MSSSHNAPLLAAPSGSLFQFLLMTLPLLGVYLYFLYLVIDRPNIADPNNPRYADDRIRLTDILITYLVTLVLFASLAVYLLWFVNKRRQLSRKYGRDAITVLGNVEYDESYYHNARKDGGSAGDYCFGFWAWLCSGFTLRNNYGNVVYDLERVANHPACDYKETKKRQLKGTVKKKVRVYYRYPREQVSVLVLPKHPFSGQPKIDMEADWASFAASVGQPPEVDRRDGGLEEEEEWTHFPQVVSRDRSLGVVVVAAFWIAFLFGASLFTTFQINKVDDSYPDENGRVAWIVFGSVVGGALPLVAFGGNFVRWRVYEHWMLESGTRQKSGGADKKSSKGSEGRKGRGNSNSRSQDDDYDDDRFGDDDGSSYIQMM